MFLVPSIALVKQIRASWLSQIDYKIATYQLWPTLNGCIGALITTFAVIPVIAKMSKKMGKKKAKIPKIIFSTYQSSKLLSGIFNKKNPIDFAVFDEAHRTAILNSKVDSYFSYAIHDKKYLY